MIASGDFQGIPALLIDTPFSTAALSLHGGQLLSFAPKEAGETLWLSSRCQPPPAAIRGGVPVCWPYFGRQGQTGEVPQHGFARNTAWTLADARVEADDETTLELALPAHSGTPLRLMQTLRIGRTLRQALTTRNTGDRTVAFTQALHSYLRVGDAARAQVTGLEGLDYTDKYDGGEHRQDGVWSLHDPRDPGRSDRLYHRSGGRFVLSDPARQRRIAIDTSGSRSVVVWNPGETGIAAIADAPPQSWRDFVCVEAANAGQDVVELAPGAAHTLQQTISVHLAGFL